MSYQYDYPRPAVTVDCVVFKKLAYGYEVLLIERGGEPFRHFWALPGGFVEMDEELDAAALRELFEETALRLDQRRLVQLGAYGKVGRDPRGRTISVVYFCVVDSSEILTVKAASDASAARWFALDSLPSLAFDHDVVMADAIQRLRREQSSL